MSVKQAVSTVKPGHCVVQCLKTGTAVVVPTRTITRRLPNPRPGDGFITDRFGYLAVRAVR